MGKSAYRQFPVKTLHCPWTEGIFEIKFCDPYLNCRKQKNGTSKLSGWVELQ